jgi:hypothetical protein
LGKLIVIAVLGSFIVFGIVNHNVNSNLNGATDNAVDHYSLTTARNISNSMAEVLFQKIAEDKNFRCPQKIQKNILGGNVSYTVTDVLLDGDSLIKISLESTYSSVKKSATIYVKSPAPSVSNKVPSGILAAITANNNIDLNGGLIVDGRDHDINGNVVSGSGTYGIWTTGGIDQNGNSKIGGTTTGTDYSPSKNGYSSVVATGQTWPGGFPTSPDMILGGDKNGLPEGTLKTIAQSGANGSQYVTNPSKLKYPLTGITYVELPSKGIWQSLSIEGSGILIVHNSSVNATMENVNSGTFMGILFTDDMIHLHADIIGSLITLSPRPSEGNCIGNGNGSILYSSETIKNGMKYTLTEATHNYGFGKHRITIVNWYE